MVKLFTEPAGNKPLWFKFYTCSVCVRQNVYYNNNNNNN